ncbi:MAG: hypothetical protein ACYSWZ_10445 [Planctomycetota bacterium]
MSSRTHKGKERRERKKGKKNIEYSFDCVQDKLINNGGASRHPTYGFGALAGMTPRAINFGG